MKLSSALVLLSLVATTWGCVTEEPASARARRGKPSSSIASGTTTDPGAPGAGSVATVSSGTAHGHLLGTAAASAKTVEVSTLGAKGALVSVAKTDVKSDATFDVAVPNGLALVQAKDAKGAVVGAGIVDATNIANVALDNTAAVQAAALVALAQNGAPDLQDTVDVIRALVDAQLADAVAQAGAGAGLADAIGAATTALGDATGALTKADPATFNKVVASGAAFTTTLAKSGAPKPVLFAGAKSVFTVESSLSTDAIVAAFQQAGVDPATIDQVTAAAGAFEAKVADALGAADLDAAKNAFEAALGGAAPNDVVQQIVAALDPLAKNLTSAFHAQPLDAAQLAGALAQFDANAPLKTLATTPKAGAVATSLSLVRKQIVP